MNKTHLRDWLNEQYAQWLALLDDIGIQRMELPGVNGDWTFKDMVAHCNGYQPYLMAKLQAAQRGEPQPPPPWPAELQTDDEINAWIYETTHDRPPADILQDTQTQFDALIAIIDSLPDDVRIDPQWHLVYFGEEYFPVGEFFDHFRDDHEADVRAWLARLDTVTPN